MAKVIPAKYFERRLAALLSAQFVIAFAIVLLRLALLGNAPFPCMNIGFSNVSGLTYGTCVVIFNLLALVPIFLLNRRYIQIGTLVNMFMVEPIVDVFYLLLEDFTSLTEPEMFVRIILLIIGVMIYCFGSSLYMMSQMGMGPYDAVGWIIAERSRLTFRSARILWDFLAVMIGFACGSTVHVGTLIMALGTGSLITFFNARVSIPLIYKGNKNLVKAK